MYIASKEFALTLHLQFVDYRRGKSFCKLFVINAISGRVRQDLIHNTQAKYSLRVGVRMWGGGGGRELQYKACRVIHSLRTEGQIVNDLICIWTHRAHPQR